jgi:hypothetical protein
MATLRRALTLALLSLAGLAIWPGWAAAAAPPKEPNGPQDLIVLSGDVLVRRGEEVGELIVIRGDVTVSGVALGDVVVVEGHIVVNGQVSGSVVNLSHDVELGAGAQVRGDVLAGGAVHAADGAQVGGSIREDVVFSLQDPIEVFGHFLVWVALSLSTLVLGFALLLLMPRAVDGVYLAASTWPWASTGWGFGALVGIPVLALLLMLSGLGLPLGVALVVGLGLLLFVGYALASWILGRLIWKPPRSRSVALLIGWTILTAVGMIPFLGGVLWLLGGVFGLGATVVATWRARGHRGRHRAGPPPVPPTPAVQPVEEGRPAYVTEGSMEEEGVGL